jgi:hypothetical protein
MHTAGYFREVLMSSLTPTSETPSTPPFKPAAAPLPAAATGRPTGVTVIALLALISGFLGLCGTSLVFFLSLAGIVIPTGVTQILGGIGLILALFLSIGPVLQIVFAYGAWNLRPWAWWLGILSTGITVLTMVIGIFGSGGAAVHTALTHGLLSIIIFVYLLFPNVRAAFRV